VFVTLVCLVLQGLVSHSTKFQCAQTEPPYLPLIRRRILTNDHPEHERSNSLNPGHIGMTIV